MVDSNLTFKHQVEKVCQILKSCKFQASQESHVYREHVQDSIFKCSWRTSNWGTCWETCMLIWRKHYMILEMLNNKRQLQKGLKECLLDWVQWCSISSSRCVYPLQVCSSSTWAQQHTKSPQVNTLLMSRYKESTHPHLQKECEGLR